MDPQASGTSERPGSYQEQFQANDPDLLQKVFGSQGPALPVVPASNRNEAYQRCGSQVVALVKCVEEHPGPAWYWSCGQVYVALQRCYDAQQPKYTSSIQGIWRQMHENATVRWERMQWWWEDILGRRD